MLNKPTNDTVNQLARPSPVGANSSHNPWWVWAGLGSMMGLILAVDLWIELGVATPAAYTAVVLATYARCSSRLTLTIALVCSVLLLVGFMGSPLGGEYWKVVTNRTLCMLALWTVSILCLRHHRDLAKRVRVEDELRESEERTGKIVDAALDAVVTMDEQGRVTGWNMEAEQMFGWSSEDVVGSLVSDRIIPERYREAHAAGLRRYVATGEGPSMNTRLELTAVRRGGEEFPVELAIVPLRLSNGFQFCGFVRDITERVQAESDRVIYAAELERSNRELSQFAYVASHDLKEPLRMVRSYTDLLAEEYEEQLDQNGQLYIRFASEGAQRMMDLIEGLLNYCRAGQDDELHEPIDLNELLLDVRADLENAIADSQAIVTSERLPRVRGNRTRLRQLFQNLISNALKFRGEQRPEVHIGCDQTTEQCEITITDNGIGIDEEYREKVFALFQRLHTREVYPGNGIGLPICRRIVEHHGGTIWADSKSDQGTTFHFTLNLPAKSDSADSVEDDLAATNDPLDVHQLEFASST